MFQYRATLLMSVSALMLLSVPAATGAQNTASAPITIVRRPGHEDGMAQMMVKGKVRKISPHAVEAWTVRGGEGALIIGLQPAKGKTPKQYLLRYFDLESGRRRLLGTVPMNAAQVAETAAKGSAWAFALSGTDATTGKPVIVVGDDQGIPGMLADASSPVMHDDSLNFQVAGENRVAPLGVLLGTARPDIYAPPESTQLSPRLLQVFPDGTALAMSREGTIQRATWQTDGQVLQMRSLHEKVVYSVPWVELETVKGVPAGKRFVVRLEQALSSRTTHQGDTIKAVSITPVVVDGAILIPAGSEFEGKVVQANSTGWGFTHETASLTVNWTQATIEGGRKLALAARVFQVENAQESVTDKGKIQGIRSTATSGLCRGKWRADVRRHRSHCLRLCFGGRQRRAGLCRAGNSLSGGDGVGARKYPAASDGANLSPLRLTLSRHRCAASGAAGICEDIAVPHENPGKQQGF